jgi:Ca2+-binding EF-hand superfamily protein
MSKKLFATALALFLGFTATRAEEEKKKSEEAQTTEKKAEEDKKAANKKVDRSKIFDKLDADSDGKISKDEFQKGMEKLGEKVKEKVEASGKGNSKAGGMLEKIMEKLFEKMDSDNDGSISKDEFNKSEIDPSNMKDIRAKFGKGKK